MRKTLNRGYAVSSVQRKTLRFCDLAEFLNGQVDYPGQLGRTTRVGQA